MPMINNVITSLVNFTHKKIDGIQNDWGRRSLGIVIFTLMAFIAIIGCSIELAVLCAISIIKQLYATITCYLVDAKDDAISFVERYFDLW
jgi:hypothetical protein